MKTAVFLVLGLALIQVAFAGQLPPIPGRRPQWTNGTAKHGIDIHVVYDLICETTKELDPAFQTFLSSTWNVTNTPVIDEIQVTYSFLPLTFHHAVWIPHKLLPYILDNCQFGPHPCILYPYTQYCFENLDDILGSYNVSNDDYTFTWVSMVANQFGLPVQELIDVFDDTKDTHNSEMRTREMFKFNTHHGVAGTPWAYVNGVLLEHFPHTADEWTSVLYNVYKSQYNPPGLQKSTDL